MKFFGWVIQKDDPNSQIEKQSLPKDENLDGALELTSSLSGWVGHGINFNDLPSEDEVQLVTKYREISRLPEIEKAVDDIINEAFAYDADDYPVKINLDQIEKKDMPDNVKDQIREEFDNILDMLNFKKDCYEIFRRWYVDGRLYYQKIIDVNNPKDGLVELQYIDPRKIKKIRQEIPQKGKSTKQVVDGIDVNKKYIEYYLYNPMGISLEQPTGLRIATDSIVFIHSGVQDRTNKVILSHLHKAIRPLNQLNMIENSLVIYRIARAPERRVFNVEVGKLPPAKAEQYLMSVRNNNRRKLIYDMATGNVQDDKRYMTMLEDFWFPKRDGKGTTVDVLQGGQNLGQLEDVDYFKKKLIEALNIPASRFDSTTAFNLGRTTEITRDELKFTKFVTRLRKRFAELFDDLLGTHLQLKGILTPEEWENIKGNFYYDFLQDNAFSELKWSDIWNNRMSTLVNSQPAIEGGFVSKRWVRENILKIKDEEWEQMQKELEDEQDEELEKKKKEQDALAPPEEENEGGDTPFDGHFKLQAVDPDDKGGGDSDGPVPKGKAKKGFPPKKSKKEEGVEAVSLKATEFIQSILTEKDALERKAEDLTQQENELKALQENLHTLIDGLNGETKDETPDR